MSRPLEAAVARILNRDRRAADVADGSRKAIGCADRGARGATRQPCGHQRAAVAVEVRQRLERAAHAPGEDIGVRRRAAVTNFEPGVS